MSINISGHLIDGLGKPIPGCVIELKSNRTSQTVIKQVIAIQRTENDGAYSLSVEPGQYRVTLCVDGYPPEYVGDIQIYHDSPDGTLNYFLECPQDGDLRPDVMKQFEAMVAKVSAQATEVEKNKNATAESALAAKNSQQAAHDSEAAVADNAAAALASQNAAKTSEQAAASSAKTAQGSQQAAHISESAAADSATAAKDSETAAAGSAIAAKDSATAAKDSENAAKNVVLDTLLNVLGGPSVKKQSFQEGTVGPDDEGYWPACQVPVGGITLTACCQKKYNGGDVKRGALFAGSELQQIGLTSTCAVLHFVGTDYDNPSRQTLTGTYRALSGQDLVGLGYIPGREGEQWHIFLAMRVL